MSIKNTKVISKEDLKWAINNSSTMGLAAKLLNVDWRTFKEAQKHNLYNPVKQANNKFELVDILVGKHPQYPTSKLLVRLVKEGYKEYRCEVCRITEYNNARIGLEVDHINGNNSDHSLSNLRILCPNCHSQTDTYRSKKLKFIRTNGKLAESGIAPDLKSEILSDGVVGSNPTLAARIK